MTSGVEPVLEDALADIRATDTDRRCRAAAKESADACTISAYATSLASSHPPRTVLRDYLRDASHAHAVGGISWSGVVGRARAIRHDLVVFLQLPSSYLW